MKAPGTTGLVFREPLLYEISAEGRSGYRIPDYDVPEVDAASKIPASLLREVPAELPEVCENGVVRHFVRLSQWNFSIDTGMYPLGSCTMKYNPKINETVARLPGFLHLHPMTPDDDAQGALQVMYELEQDLAEITGMDGVTLQPAAGAHGELTALMMIRAYHESKGRPRKVVLVPESAHGTNAASCAMCGYDVIAIPNGPEGYVETESVRALMNDEVAAIMVTNPNTLGLFEKNIRAIADIVHEQGGLVYGDGANMNALLGRNRPGDAGIDVMHLNLHKTFSTPHGGGGPGAGPVAVRDILLPHLPSPRIVKEGDRYRREYNLPESIGKVRGFEGNFGMFIRAFAYIRSLGPNGLKEIADKAVLNANYIRVKLEDTYHLPHPGLCMHEVVFNDKHLKETGAKTMDVAKRLIDYGFHSPTVYFPLVVPGAIMIEPTESETKETIDQFIDAMKRISAEAFIDVDLLHNAPSRPILRRLDETSAARKPILRWLPPDQATPGGKT